MLERFRRYKDSGQDLVEHALVLPFLMFLVLGIVEFSLAIWHYDTVANVAREVARCAIIYNNTTNIEQCKSDAITRYGTGVNLTSSMIAVDTAWDSGDATRVQVDWEYQPILGLILNSALPMRTVSTMRNEY
jgi:Flp pilus assembly protein TadG